jgi:hypothetical protein
MKKSILHRFGNVKLLKYHFEGEKKNHIKKKGEAITTTPYGSPKRGRFGHQTTTSWEI